MQICSSNNSFNKIIIPISDSNRHLVSLTPDLLLSKYGIHADVVLNTDENVISVGGSYTAVGGGAVGGGESNISFPYSWFHTFFSLFSFGKPDDTKPFVNVVDKPLDKPLVDADVVDDDVVDAAVVDKPVDKPLVNAAVVDAAVVDAVVVDKPIDKPIVDDKSAVVEPIVDDEPVDVKSIEITIHSIDGIRNW